MSTLTLPVEASDHIRGNPNAPVTLLEYGDYECPNCGEAYYIVKMLQDTAGDALKVAYRNFPLSQIHPHAVQAAWAAEAAGKQGEFWEMHDIIFENQDHLEEGDLVQFADALDLNLEQFVADIASDGVRQKVQDDFRSGVRSGVNGTPTFFVNGIRHDGTWDYQDLLAAIRQAARE